MHLGTCACEQTKYDSVLCLGHNLLKTLGSSAAYLWSSRSVISTSARSGSRTAASAAFGAAFAVAALLSAGAPTLGALASGLLWPFDLVPRASCTSAGRLSPAATIADASQRPDLSMMTIQLTLQYCKLTNQHIQQRLDLHLFP